MEAGEQITKPAAPPFAGRSADSEFQVEFASPAPNVVTLGADAPPRVYIGHSAWCEIRLSDPRVSRRHAALDIVGSHVLLSDLESRNGTFVNGVMVVQARLVGGEVLKVGDTTLRFSLVGSRTEPRTRSDRFGRVLGASVEMRRAFVVLERLARGRGPCSWRESAERAKIS